MNDKLTDRDFAIKVAAKKYTLYGVFALIGVVAIGLIFGMVGDEINNRVVDAEINEEALQNDLKSLEQSANEQQTQINAMIEILKAHEIIIQQHDMQVQRLENNTNIIGNWAGEFSQNVNERLVALEGKP